MIRKMNGREQRRAGAMRREVNASAVTESVVPVHCSAIDPLRATSFRFPASFVERLDVFQRSNELNPARLSKTYIVQRAVEEYMARHESESS